MSYFQHTKRDLADAKREIGEALLALIQDTNDKLNADELDRTYVIEDLLARSVALAHEAGADISLFEVGNVFRRHVPAYPLAGPDSETTQELPRMKSIVSVVTLREVHNATTFDGYPRHAFERGTLDQFACGAQIRSTHNMTGDPVTCNRRHDNAIHDWMW